MILKTRHFSYKVDYSISFSGNYIHLHIYWSQILMRQDKAGQEYTGQSI